MVDEKLLIKKILKGDTSAFSYFVSTYQDMSITIAYRICGNMQDAEDIVQNSFVKAYHNLASYRNNSKFSTWLYRIVYNTSITHIGSNPIKNEFANYDDIKESNYTTEWNILNELEENERKKIINEALDKLPSDEKVILTLFYLEELTIKEVSSITNLTEANIKVKLYRARKHLAEILRPMLEF